MHAALGLANKLKKNKKRKRQPKRRRRKRKRRMKKKLKRVDLLIKVKEVVDLLINKTEKKVIVNLLRIFKFRKLIFKTIYLRNSKNFTLKSTFSYLHIM